MDETAVFNKIRELSAQYTQKLQKQILLRNEEMKSDDKSHYLIYRILGISTSEGEKIDLYQNKGRFLYKYAGSFLEEAALLCFQSCDPNSQVKLKIPNTEGKTPKTFEIDCLSGNFAHEIKWRDATTDGDHITKEHTRLLVIRKAGFIPVRVMFYSPNRSQAQKIQATLKTLYKGVGGQYYAGQDAWDYIHHFTKINLLSILESIADTKPTGETYAD